MKIAMFFNKEREDTTGAYLERAFQKLGVAYDHYWTERANELDKKYDLYLRIDHGDYKYDLPEKLRPSVFYAIDTHLKKPYKKIKMQASHYDMIFCVHKEGAVRLSRELRINARWLPVACDPDIHKKIDTQKIYDIGFVGTEGKKSPRKVLLERLRKKYPASFLGTAPYTEIGAIYSKSRIGFNYSINNDVNMRMFEVLSCGAMLLTNRIKNNGFDEIFEDRKNVVVYRNPRELFKLAEYYLSHDKEGGGIAACGYELVMAKHTYLHRAKLLLEKIGETLFENKGAIINEQV